MNIHACPGVLTFLSCLTLAVAVRADNVTGRVVNTVGQGVAGVTLQFSGFTPLNPVTAPDGTFNIVVPAGTYDIGFVTHTTSLAK